LFENLPLQQGSRERMQFGILLLQFGILLLQFGILPLQFGILPLQFGILPLHFGILPLQQGNSHRVHAVWYILLLPFGPKMGSELGRSP
jgi:hypothetical protein